jgi:hypothetical protein
MIYRDSKADGFAPGYEIVEDKPGLMRLRVGVIAGRYGLPDLHISRLTQNLPDSDVLEITCLTDLEMDDAASERVIIGAIEFLAAYVPPGLADVAQDGGTS